MAEPAFKDVPLRREIEDLAKQQDHHTLACWATECAARVLPIFEAYQLEDLRARDAINAGRGWIRGEITMVDARKAALQLMLLHGKPIISLPLLHLVRRDTQLQRPMSKAMRCMPQRMQ